MPRLFRPRNLAVAVLSLGLTMAAAPSALATDAEEDPRATLHEGNATDCEQFGGGILVKVGDGDDDKKNASLTYEGGLPNQDQYLTITGVPDGIVVTAIVVKGGNHYNVYVPGERGLSESVPWEDLRSPLNGGGNIPTISHWFACGEEAPSETPTTEPETSEPNPGEPEPSETGSEEPPTSEPTGVPSSTAVSEPTTSSNPTGGSGAPETTESAPAPVVEDDDLASTGFSGGWLIGLGAALLAGGGALLVMTRMRKGKTTS